MQVLYFSWLRERIGTAGEEVDPGDAVTARDLIAALSTRSEAHAVAFADTAAIRVAVDQEMVEMDAPLAGAREVAFFPPVTGG